MYKQKSEVIGRMNENDLLGFIFILFGLVVGLISYIKSDMIGLIASLIMVIIGVIIIAIK